MMIRNSHRLEIDLIGDSLSTGFHAGTVPGMLWRAHCGRGSNWFEDDSGLIDSITARLRGGYDVTAKNWARVSARVDHVDARQRFRHFLIGLVSLSGQLQGILTRDHLPD